MSPTPTVTRRDLGRGPHCGTRLDAHYHPDGGTRAEGDLVFCSGCAATLVVTAALRLSPATEEALASLSADQRAGLAAAALAFPTDASWGDHV